MRSVWVIVALAGSIMMVGTGLRMCVGLFVHPLMMEQGLRIGEISMCLAIGQVCYGLFQPFFGMWTDRGHGLATLVTGAACLALGQVVTMLASNAGLLLLAQGVLSPLGSAACSFGILMVIAGRHLPHDKRSIASGFINSGGSLGQFVFAPIAQFFIQMRGYCTSLGVLACFSLAVILPAWLLCGKARQAAASARQATGSPAQTTFRTRERLGEQLRVALRDHSYVCLAAGFFTCGFHVAFLSTHLPGEVSACGHAASVSAISLSLIGLCNIAGSIGSGILGKYCRMKLILACAYAARALMIAAFMLSSRSEMAFYIFAATTGLTWLATVPPTAGLVGKLFGQRHMATLFGMVFFAHQIGAFLGAWLGGIAVETSGSLEWVWWVDVGLAGMAALINLPIREDAPGRAQTA